MELVERIKSLCQERGITLNQLEKAVGLKGTIARWTEHEPSVGKVSVVARYFGMTVSELIEDNWKSIDMTDAWEEESPTGSVADGAEEKLKKLSPELRALFVRFLALAAANPEKAMRYLSFAVQELEAPK